jgi:hypothetical protein
MPLPTQGSPVPIDSGFGTGTGLGAGGGGGTGFGGGGGGGTTFFGVQGTGRRVAFIVDKSGSMSRGNRMDRARAEVTSAISYPLFVLGFGMVTVAVLLTVVLPKLFSMLEDMLDALPLPSRCRAAGGSWRRQIRRQKMRLEGQLWRGSHRRGRCQQAERTHRRVCCHVCGALQETEPRHATRRGRP